jgi:hypothetical protein
MQQSLKMESESFNEAVVVSFIKPQIILVEDVVKVVAKQNVIRTIKE